MKDIATRTPADSTAARVTSPGPKGLESGKRIAQVHSDVPLPMQQDVPPAVKDLRGRTVGKLTVIGLAKPTGRSTKQNGSGRLWVVRCSCGHYETRRAKAINNPKNADIDACDLCRHVTYLQRLDAHRQEFGPTFVPSCCGSTDMLGCEYAPDDPYHFDGVSEWVCKTCGTRYGRWTRRRLRGDEREPRP